jgi:hypothetical protein
MGEWELPHTIKSGDTLWKLSAAYYGKSSMGGVHAIYGVPQNKAIQGPSADSGLIPGDVILIPGLPQPAVAPAASDAMPSTLPQQPLDGTPPTPTPAGSPLPAPVASGAPVGWPTDVPYPPTSASGGAIVVPATNGGPPTVIPVTITGDAPAKAAAKFWTGGRIALASAAGVLGVGTILWLAMRKPKRHNPRRRRAA